MTTVARLVHYLHDFAPLRLAADWDNVGLLLGQSDANVARLMTCLTITPEVVREALRDKADLIVTHHPLLFKATQKITGHSTEGQMLLELIRSGVAVYSPHTAFDNCKGGINDGLARRLQLKEVRPLRGLEGAGQCKIVVFVPEKDLANVSDALFEAGAGNIGQYSQCSFRLFGTGTFFGSEASKPTVGQKGRREEAPEWRLEAICAEAQVDAAVRAMRRAHSYEEPAYDVYPLRPDATRAGQGRIGTLPQAISLKQLATKVKKLLRANHVQVVGDWQKPVQRVALACGAAGEFLSDAIRQQADVFLTGEMRFHDGLTAQARGVGVLLPGHYATERPGIEDLAEQLGRDFTDVKVWASADEADPFQSI